MSDERCHCGQPLHYADAGVRAYVEEQVRILGRDVPVTVGARTWLVSRHYIALHGLKAIELPALGFPEVIEQC